ncbi:MAG: cytochrome C oxidase subunit IV family protein [Chloroflexi bacterium]|nr:cytochrome C oxidase subunit IV family protein [Chloroflexota bacterium]
MVNDLTQPEHRPGGAEHAHPGPLTYAKIAAVLTVITTIEVAVYYVDYLHVTGLLTPILLVLSATKFAFVVMFYMHLKFDHRLFSGFFVFGLFVAASIVIALMILLSQPVAPGVGLAA